MHANQFNTLTAQEPEKKGNEGEKGNNFSEDI